MFLSEFLLRLRSVANFLGPSIREAKWGAQAASGAKATFQQKSCCSVTRIGRAENMRKIKLLQ